jgi:hypothetical protein
MEADRVIALNEKWTIDGGDKNLHRILFCGQFLHETNNQTRLVIYFDGSSIINYWTKFDEVVKLWRGLTDVIINVP